MISIDLLDRLATTDRLQCNSALEFGTVGAALAHRWEPRSGAVRLLRSQQWGLSKKPVHLTERVASFRVAPGPVFDVV